jgi:pimeloyl-ACP methyl ester carboxylesterase
MKVKISVSLLILGTQTIFFGQNLEIKTYEFISKAQDTVQAELGTFNVIEDRENGGKDTIQLSFVRFKSTNPNPKSPIIYLSGGPGGSGTGTARGGRFELFMKLREVADVIAFDQRGTGRSEKLPNCPYTAEFELSKPTYKKEYIVKTTANISKCLDYWNAKNINLKAYNTSESAKDLDALRKALHTDKISLWGISYGSHLAFEYIRLFEKNIDKMVLASLEGSNETIKLPKDTENFVFQIAENAEDNYGSEIKYKDLKSKIIAVHKRLKENPVTSSYKNRSGVYDTVGISNFELQSAIATFYLKNPTDSKKLPKIYTQMYTGNFSEIASDVMVMKKYIFNRISPMAFAMDMQSGISDERRKKVSEQIDTSILGSSINFLRYEWMMHINFPQLPNEVREMEENKVDALLLSGTLDGRTYVNTGIEVAEKFKNGQHVIIVNAGHDLYMESPLIGDLVVDFLKGKDLNLKTIVLAPTASE